MKAWLAAALLLQASSLRASELPRLAGTVVASGQRVALFSVASGGVLPVGIGDAVGDYVVREIRPGQVELQSAGQQIIVSIEGAAIMSQPDTAGATFGLVLHQQGRPDD